MSWNFWFLIIYFKVLLIKSTSFRLLLVILCFTKISIIRLFPILLFKVIFFFHIKLSSWRSTWCSWPWWFIRIKTDFDELIKGNICRKAKRYKFKEIVKIFICKNSIVNALKLTIQIYCSFKSSYFRLIPVAVY